MVICTVARTQSLQMRSDAATATTAVPAEQGLDFAVLQVPEQNK